MKTAGRPYILLFIFLSVVYHSNLRPIASGDSLSASLIPFCILLDGSIYLDRFAPYITEHIWYGPEGLRQRGGHWYSIYPITGPALATPLYIPIAYVPWIRKQPPGTVIAIARMVEKITAVAFAAGAAVFLLFLLRRLTSERSAWMLTLLFALGTGNWSTSSQAMWQHTFGTVAIIGCLYAIERCNASDAEARWYWIAGAFAAFALAIRPTNLALVPALALALAWRSARPMHYVRVFALPAVGAALITAYNFAVFHQLTGGYSGRLGRRFLEGLPGILLSPGRGLLIYTPLAIFALAVFAPRARESRNQHLPLVIAASVFCLLHIGIIAAWPNWWGGYCWGPRLLAELSAPVIILIAVGLPAISRKGFKTAFAATAVYCFLIQALGVYCYPKGHWDHLPVSVNGRAHYERLWNWADNPVIRTARGGIAWEPYAIVAAAATGGLPAAAKKIQQLGINEY
jgi:hypothetical protein